MSSSRHFSNSLFREIYKNTWLTKHHNKQKDAKKKKERVWTVFCIHDDAQAFLEAYTDNKIALLHKPDWLISLNSVQHISPTICAQDEEYEFVITLTDDVIRLAAPSWNIMSDWVESLRSKLLELGILTPKENLYSKLPEARTPLLHSTRDPMSPLPPPPPSPILFPPGVEHFLAIEPENGNPSSNSVDRSMSSTTMLHSSPPLLQRGVSLPEGITSESEHAVGSLLDGAPVSTTQVFNFDLSSISSMLPDETVSSVQSEASNTDYEMILTDLPPGPSTRQVRVERSVSNPQRPLQAPPQPYRTLREQQVLQLQKEMQHATGVRLHLRRKDCISSIAFCEAMGTVWISGWKQKEHPMLYNVLHIGDQLIAVEGVRIQSASDAHKILRSVYGGLYVNMLIKRVPYGEVLVIRRESEGQSLGITLVGNTAVIETVEPDSLAARHGLSSKARTCDGLSLTNWVLTEINSRPLNLFYKENQVRDRLNSVGRDISILVQPLDLIKLIKKQLKSTRNYKEYTLQ